jgi:NitT/TauT family transport system substrate-binding protein
MLRPTRTIAQLVLVVAAAGCHGKRAPAAAGVVRLGFFPNITHAPALVGLERGDFARALAPLTVEPKAFNAGPEAMEALLAGALDAAYVGPAPAINAHLRTQGELLLVVAGAAQDGAGLVVRPLANITRAADLHGKKLATPQLGNTQDVALRTYLRVEQLKTSDRGGDVQVMPLANADSFSLFQRGQLDGAWVPEPWLSRLVDEAGGTLFLDERERWPQHHFPATLLVVTKALARERPEVVQKLVAAHAATIAWMAAHDAEARALTDAGLQKWAKKRLPQKVLNDAWSRVHFSTDIMPDALDKQLTDARALGLTPGDGDLRGFVDGHFLAAVTGTP